MGSLVPAGADVRLLPQSCQDGACCKNDPNVAQEIFDGVDLGICEGHTSLGTPIGKPDFVDTHITQQVEKWTTKVKKLAIFAQSQPHAALAAFTHGLSGEWTFLQRTVVTWALS